MHQRIIFFVAFLFSCSMAVAQTGTIRGFVYERSTGEPMSYTNVVIQGTNIGVQTDLNGYFSIPQLQPGTYTLWTTLLGYDTATATVTLKANAIVTQKLYLQQQELTLQGVEVSASRTERQTQVNVGTTTITPREM